MMKWIWIALLLAGTVQADVIVGSDLRWGTHVVFGNTPLVVEIINPQNTSIFTNPVQVSITVTGYNQKNIWWMNGTIKHFYTIPVNSYFQQNPNKNGILYLITAYANNSYGVVSSDQVYFTMYVPPSNTSLTTESNLLATGSPFKAAEEAHEQVMGPWFLTLITAFLFVGFWLRTNNFMYATIITDLMWYLFKTNMIADITYLIYGLNALLLGIIVYRLFSPGYTT